MTTVLRALSLGELLDRAFTLYRRHFVVFVAIVAVPNLAVLGLQLLNLATLGDGGSLLMQLGFLVATMATSLLTYSMSQAASIVAVSELHLDRPITIAGAYRAIGHRVLAICGITVLVGILITVGFLMLILPGIYLVLRWSLVIPVAVLEDAGAITAMERSGELTRGDLGRILVIYVLYFLLAMVFSSVWMIPVGILVVMSGGDPTDLSLALQVIIQVGSYLVTCLFGPLLTIAMSLVYYDERVRKEAFDLEHLLAQVEGKTGASPSPA